MPQPSGTATATAVKATSPNRTWLVTAPHQQPGPSRERAPWGTHHFIRNGARRTACGLSTLTWIIFWERVPHHGHPDACPDCVRSMATRHAGAPST